MLMVILRVRVGKSFQILFLIFILSGTWDFWIISAQTENTNTNNFDGIEVSGLIIDETISKLGKDFYDLVYSKWDSNSLQGNQSIFISEKPQPSFGSQISISIDDNLIFQQNIRPNEEALQELSDYVVAVFTEYFQNYEQIQKDLAGNELKGTGIY